MQTKKRYTETLAEVNNAIAQGSTVERLAARDAAERSGFDPHAIAKALHPSIGTALASAASAEARLRGEAWVKDGGLEKVTRAHLPSLSAAELPAAPPAPPAPPAGEGGEGASQNP